MSGWTFHCLGTIEILSRKCYPVNENFFSFSWHWIKLFLKRKLEILIFNSLPRSWQGINLCFFNMRTENYILTTCQDLGNGRKTEKLRFLFLKGNLKILILNSVPKSQQRNNLCFSSLLCYGTGNSDDISTLSLYRWLTQLDHKENVKSKWKMFYTIHNATLLYFLTTFRKFDTNTPALSMFLWFCLTICLLFWLFTMCDCLIGKCWTLPYQ